MTPLYDLAISLLGTPYVWGGKCPLIGLDCSGLIDVLLRPYRMDMNTNAQGMYDHISHANKPSDAVLGALVFYGASAQAVDHVGMCLTPSVMIEAGGGGPHVTSVALAAQHNAYVKLAPIYHTRRVGIFLPPYLEL